MPLSKQQNVLGISNAKIAEVTANTTETYTIGTRMDLPELSSMEVTVSSETKEAVAGLTTVDSMTFKKAYDVKFESANIPLDVIAKINGATLTESGTTPNQIVTVTDKASDVPVLFNLEFDTDFINGEAADLHMELFCVKGFLDVVSKADDYWTCSFEGQGVIRKKDKAFRTITANETRTAIGANDSPSDDLE